MSPSASLRHGLEAHEQAGAAAARQSSRRSGSRPRRLVDRPYHWTLQRHQRGEQRARVVAVGDQVQVDEDQLARAVLADVGDHVLDRLLQLLAAPGRGRDAELAVVHAAARGLEHGLREEVAFVQQVAARERQAGETRARGSGRNAASIPRARSRAAARARLSRRSPCRSRRHAACASSGISVTCGPPRTTVMPRRRKCAASSYARVAVPVMTVMPTRSASRSSGMSPVPSS